MAFRLENRTNLYIGLWIEAGAHNPEVTLDPGEAQQIGNLDGEVISEIRSAPNVGQAFNRTYLPANQPGYRLPNTGTVRIDPDGQNLMVSDGSTGMGYTRQ
ncbi:hypothetical protein [Afifella pfennigii]|uniref:hypothetical protein n=1 Tax=Afifella pfennigii TaxID=209897 RepID=UPI00047DF625|nr:hypothetical protein [Afifella pfennigii]